MEPGGVHVCTPSQKVEAGGAEDQGQLWLHSEFQECLGYSCNLKKAKQNNAGQVRAWECSSVGRVFTKHCHGICYYYLDS